jgi:signal transduction histidine kinase
VILAVSRFKVANGLEAEVAEAFRRRPHRVDRAPGFLGLETFTEEGDASVFYLVTRWTDAASFRAWHRSPEHKASHEGIPAGLKLDAAWTRVTVLERLPFVTLEEATADAAPAIADFLRRSEGTVFLTCARDGTVKASNEVLDRRLDAGPLLGRVLWDFLTAADVERLRARLARGERLDAERFLLNFVDAAHAPFSLRCQLDPRPDGFLLLGEAPAREEAALQAELLRLNNDLSTSHREARRSARELAALNAELERRVSIRTRDLEAFTYTVAHDLRAPLRAISGYGLMLEEDYAGKILDEEGQGFARRMGEAARRLDVLIRDLLEYSRLGGGALPLRAEDPAAALREALADLEPEIRRTGAAVEVVDVLPPVRAHRGALRRIFTNLIENALKFVPADRAPRVRIRGERRPPRVRLWVEDNGPGIAPEHHERIFRVFERLDPRRGPEGTGIGLAIVRRAVEAMGGSVGLESAPGAGSRFFVELDEA